MREITQEYRDFIYNRLGAAIPIEETEEPNVVNVKVPFEIRLTKDFTSFLKNTLEAQGIRINNLILQPVHVQDLKNNENMDVDAEATNFQISI